MHGRRILLADILRKQRRCDQELKVCVAAVAGLAYIIGGAAKGLLPLDLASKPIVAFVAGLHVWLRHQGLPSSADTSPPHRAVDQALDAEDSKEPKPASRTARSPQGLLGFLSLLLVLDACLDAGVLVIRDAEAVHILGKRPRPHRCVSSDLLLCGPLAVRSLDVQNLAFFVHLEELVEATACDGASIRLRSTEDVAETGSLAICGKDALDSTC